MLDVIILAAGKGTRMHSDTPKVLHTLAGQSFLQHVLNKAQSLHANNIHVVVGHGSEAVKAALPDNINVVEQTEQLGTGHAVMQVLPHLADDTTTLILYGDVPLTSADTLQKLLTLPSQNSMGLLTVNLDNPMGYGRIVRVANSVQAIVEQKDATPDQLLINEVNTGVMAVNSTHLKKWVSGLSNQNAQNEYYLTDIIAAACADNISVNTSQPTYEHEVLGVNNRLQQAQLERIYQMQMAQLLMEKGATLLDPARFDCRGTLTVGKDCVIDVNCIFEGDVVLGDNVVINANCIIKNSTIESDCVIDAYSNIDEAHLKAHCRVGPYARLRPQTVLEEAVRIGNFVEVKKSTIGQGSKINHLSYIGDAEIGHSVNVGAGAITCNYDGHNKHVTRIGDNAFIGSNSVLIAPISVGNNAFTAAGSALSSNVEDDRLAISRAQQKNISGWKRPTKN